MRLIGAYAFAKNAVRGMLLNPFSNWLDLKVDCAVSVSGRSIRHAHWDVYRADRTMQLFKKIDRVTVSSFALYVNPLDLIFICVRLQHLRYISNSPRVFCLVSNICKDKGLIRDFALSGKN